MKLTLHLRGFCVYLMILCGTDYQALCSFVFITYLQGPLMSTRLEQPLTFTLTPEFGNQQRDLSVYEAQRIRNDFTPLTLGHINNGCTECQYHQ
jgi:hypothetical protein